MSRLPLRAFLRSPSRIGMLIASVLIVAACGYAADRQPTEQDLAAIAVTSAPADQAQRVGLEMAQSKPAFRRAPVSAGGSAAASPEQPMPQVDPAGMIIRNGHVVVEVDSLEIAIARVRRLADALGATVGNVTLSTGEQQVRSATLELKVPVARFDSAMTGMAPLGKVEQSTTTAQDVGEEFVDISARLANARRLESRLIQLLATRTGKLEDVLAVERELARVREEIERYEGRMRYLATRVATSTIVASLHEPEPVIASPGQNVMGNAFLNMWRNFVRFIAGLIEAMGVLIPVAALIVAGAFAWKRWARHEQRARPGIGNA